MMFEDSRIPGYPHLVAETMYRPQEEYAFVGDMAAKEFEADPNFVRQPEGPFIKEYFEHYEANRPYSNALYSPMLIKKEDVNRQCNPLVAYPFGVPRKYALSEKCARCNHHKKVTDHGAKRRDRRRAHGELDSEGNSQGNSEIPNGMNNDMNDNDLFASPLIGSSHLGCCGSSNRTNDRKEERQNSEKVSSHLLLKDMAKTATFQMKRHEDEEEGELIMKLRRRSGSNSICRSMAKLDQRFSYMSNPLSPINSNMVRSYLEAPDCCSNPSSNYVLPFETGSKCSSIYHSQVAGQDMERALNSARKPSSNLIHSSMEGPHKIQSQDRYSTSMNSVNVKGGNAHTANNLNLIPRSVPSSSNRLSQASDGNSSFPSNSIFAHASAVKPKKSLYIQINSNDAQKYPNVISSDERLLGEKRRGKQQPEKSGELSGRDRKKPPTHKKYKNQKSKNLEVVRAEKKHRDSRVLVASKDLTTERSVPRKGKILKDRKSGGDTDKVGLKKKQVKICNDEKTNDGSHRADDEPGRNLKKKNSQIKKIRTMPALKDRTKGETYSRICKMHFPLDDTDSRNKCNGHGLKTVSSSIEDFADSNISNRTYTKSRVVYGKRTAKAKSTTPNQKNAHLNLESPSKQRNGSLNEDAESKPRSSLQSNGTAGTAKRDANKMADTKGNDNEITKKKPKEESSGTIKKISNATKNRILSYRTQPTNNNNMNQAKGVSKNAPLKRKAIQINASHLDLAAKNAALRMDPQRSGDGAGKAQGVHPLNKLTNKQGNRIPLAQNTKDLIKAKPSGITLNNSTQRKRIGNNRAMQNVPLKKDAMAPAKVNSESNPKTPTKKHKAQLNGSLSDGHINSVDADHLSNEAAGGGGPRRFGRSETKLYTMREKILPFKTTDIHDVLLKESLKLKKKQPVKPKEAEGSGKKLVKELIKRKKTLPSHSNSPLTTTAGKNESPETKGTVKNKKAELYKNILSITKNIKNKTNEEGSVEEKGSNEKGAGKGEEKKMEKEYSSDSTDLKNKKKPTLSAKGKKLGGAKN